MPSVNVTLGGLEIFTKTVSVLNMWGCRRFPATPPSTTKHSSCIQTSDVVSGVVSDLSVISSTQEDKWTLYRLHANLRLFWLKETWAPTDFGIHGWWWGLLGPVLYKWLPIITVLMNDYPDFTLDLSREIESLQQWSPSLPTPAPFSSTCFGVWGNSSLALGMALIGY